MQSVDPGLQPAHGDRPEQDLYVRSMVSRDDANEYCPRGVRAITCPVTSTTSLEVTSIGASASKRDRVGSRLLS